MTTWASKTAVKKAAGEWTDDQVNCRTYGHTWRAQNATDYGSFWTVLHRCSRCRTTREQDIDKSGYPLSGWRMNYRRGYLLEGLGRVGADGRAILRVEALRNLTILEPEDGDE